MVYPEYLVSSLPTALPTNASNAEAGNGVTTATGYDLDNTNGSRGNLTAYSLTGISQNSGNGSITLNSGVTATIHLTDYATFTITQGETDLAANRRIIPESAIRRSGKSFLQKHAG